jgi:hypothetical protein
MSLGVDIYAHHHGEDPRVVLVFIADEEQAEESSVWTVELPLAGALQVSAMLTQQLYLAAHLQPGQTTQPE